jgi:two-component sensor histidine kinase
VATYYGGLAYLDGNQFVNPFEGYPIDEYYVTTIQESPDGKLWFGTSGGITLYIPEEDSDSLYLQNFSREHGMLLMETNFLWVDEQNEILWQGTNGGLHSLNLGHYNETGEMLIEHHRLSRYGIGVETTHKALFEKEGKLWFGSMNGIIVLDPAKIRSEMHIPRSYVTDFYLNGSTPDWSEFGHNLEYEIEKKVLPNVTFPNNSSSYTFHFTGLDFSNPQSVEFRYRLGGLEDDWNRPTKNRNTTYSNLSPGSYTFNLQAISGQGPWSETASYEFSVEKPYWMKSWFWISILLLIALAFAGVYRSKMKRLERDRLSQLVDERTSQLLQAVKEKEILVKEIHHRVKNNLAMIIGLLELQATRSSDEVTINTLNDSILRIYSMSLVHEKLYSTDHLTNVDVQNYISDLMNVISNSMNLENYNIKIIKNIDSFTLSLDQGITCGLLINELVTNAIKHAFADSAGGTIRVDFELSNEKRILTVSDDGKGFPSDFKGFRNPEKTEGSSLGLTLITTLTQQMNGTITVVPVEKGAKIRISF